VDDAGDPIYVSQTVGGPRMASTSDDYQLRYILLALAVMFLPVLALEAVRHLGFEVPKAYLQVGLASLMGLAGLRTLFLLAALGPRSDEQTGNRVQVAAIGVAAVLLAVAWVIPNKAFSWTIQIAAVVFVLGARRGWLTRR
jgi:hypothetical protein